MPLMRFWQVTVFQTENIYNNKLVRRTDDNRRNDSKRIPSERATSWLFAVGQLAVVQGQV